MQGASALVVDQEAFLCELCRLSLATCSFPRDVAAGRRATFGCVVFLYSSSAGVRSESWRVGAAIIAREATILLTLGTCRGR
jgi:hypothetical protein